MTTNRAPLTPFQIYAKATNDEMTNQYRKDNDLDQETPVNPIKLMQMTAQRWNQKVKPNPEKLNEYIKKADAYNHEHHLDWPRPSEEQDDSEEEQGDSEEESGSSEDEPQNELSQATNPFLEFCRWFRKDYQEKNSNWNSYDESIALREKWREILEDEKLNSEWVEKAKKVNLERGIIMEKITHQLLNLNLI